MQYKLVKPDGKIYERLIKTGWKLARKTSRDEWYTSNGEYDPYLNEHTIQLWINSKDQVSGVTVWKEGHAVHGEIYQGRDII